MVCDSSTLPTQIDETTVGAESFRFGSNLARLRLECGWSFDEMARATDIDKKLILGHVNKGKKAHPGTMATYAQTFSEKLGRPVTVTELES